MPFATVNSVALYYEITGSGEPMVLVHGSWGDHHNWDTVVPLLSNSFQVVTFDRRGHSQSQTASRRRTWWATPAARRSPSDWLQSARTCAGVSLSTSRR
jgi:pimeloyl-ACP methyl ester carboxylesterase